MTDLAAIKARHVRQGHNERRGWLGSCADCGMSWPCDAAQLLALLADTPSVEVDDGDGGRWKGIDGEGRAIRPSVEPAGLAEALRALSADDPLALPGGDMRYAETLAARLWHAADHDCTIDGAAILAALLPTQASDSPEKT